MRLFYYTSLRQTETVIQYGALTFTITTTSLLNCIFWVMEWYEIFGVIVFVVEGGGWLRGKFMI